VTSATTRKSSASLVEDSGFQGCLSKLSSAHWHVLWACAARGTGTLSLTRRRILQALEDKGATLKSPPDPAASPGATNELLWRPQARTAPAHWQVHSRAGPAGGASRPPGPGARSRIVDLRLPGLGLRLEVHLPWRRHCASVPLVLSRWYLELRTAAHAAGRGRWHTISQLLRLLPVQLESSLTLSF
jgi:hypothetical protein